MSKSLLEKYNEKVRSEWQRHVFSCNFSLREKRKEHPTYIKTYAPIHEYNETKEAKEPRFVHFAKIGAIAWMVDGKATNLENEPAIMYENEWSWTGHGDQKYVPPSYHPLSISKYRYVLWSSVNGDDGYKYRVNFMQADGSFTIVGIQKNNYEEYLAYAEECDIDLFNPSFEDIVILKLKFKLGN